MSDEHWNCQEALGEAQDRVRELEAERADDQTRLETYAQLADRTAEKLYAANARIAELEAERETWREIDLRAAERIHELADERDHYTVENTRLTAHMIELEAERDRLKAALQALYDDCAEYIGTNQLYRADGTSAVYNQVMRQARAALSDPSGE
jgi:chromosome segregation ATPase